jgi:putative DNA primase/helicase
MNEKVKSYASIQPVKQTWLWPERIPVGQITLVAGNSDSAKSLFLADVIARVTKGAEWPDGSGRAPKGNVLVFGEDPVDSVHGPRLIAAGADLRRVVGWSGSFVLDEPTDMTGLRAYLAKHRPKLVVFDPLQDYLTHAHNYRAVRATLIALAEAAREFGIAVVCVGHPPKAAANVEPIHAFGGSRGIVAASRQFWFIARQDNDVRLLLWTKSNLSELRAGLEFKPVPKTIQTNDGTSINTVTVEWNPAPVNMTAGEWYLLERSKLKATEPKGAKAAAMSFLSEILGDGEIHPASEILAAADELEIKRGSLHAAKVAMGIKITKLPVEDGGWVWVWPEATLEPEAKPEPEAKRTRNSKAKRTQEVTHLEKLKVLGLAPEGAELAKLVKNEEPEHKPEPKAKRMPSAAEVQKATQDFLKKMERAEKRASVERHDGLTASQATEFRRIIDEEPD